MDTEDLSLLVNGDAQLAKGYVEVEELIAVGQQLQEISNAADAKLLAGGYTPSERKDVFSKLMDLVPKDELSVTIPDQPAEGLKASMEETNRIVEITKQAIAYIWKTIVAAVRELRLLAIRIYNQVFTEVARLQRAAHGLMRSASLLENMEADQSKEIRLGDKTRYLLVNANAPDHRIVKNLLEGLNDLAAFNKHVCMDYYAAAKAQCHQIEAFLNSVDPTSDVSLKTTSFGITSIKPIPLSNCAIPCPASTEGSDAVRTKPLLGGVSLVQETFNPNARGNFTKHSEEQFHLQYVLGRSRVFLTQVNPNAAPIPSEDNKVILAWVNTADIIRLLAQVVQGCETIQSYRKSFAERERINVAIMEAAERYKLKADRSVGLNDSNLWLAQAFMSLPKYGMEILDRPNTSWVAHATKVYTSVFYLCKGVVDAYQKS